MKFVRSDGCAICVFVLPPNVPYTGSVTFMPSRM